MAAGIKLKGNKLVMSTSKLMSYTFSSTSFKYGRSFVSFSILLHLNGSSASANTTHALMVVPKFFELKGPSGTYSQACMSLADQSFIKTTPKRLFLASSIGTGLPILLARHTKAPSSSSKSSRRRGARIGSFSFGFGLSRICPNGLRIGVPDTTTEEARP